MLLPHQRRRRKTRFDPVLDRRKRPIRGLWKRGDVFYAQLRVDVGGGMTSPRRVRLEAVSLAGAKEELEKRRTERVAGKLRKPGWRPLLRDLIATYKGGGAFALKKPGTRENEAGALARWADELGSIRIDRLEPKMIHAVREKRLAEGSHPRTVNLSVVALRNALRHAVEAGELEDLPKVRPLKCPPAPRRPMLSREHVDGLLAACSAVDDEGDPVTVNGDLLRFYIRFLQFSGAREVEALGVRWADVDFHRGLVTIGADGNSKNRRARTVDFNPSLRELLEEMRDARPPDTAWLFPSPRRGDTDRPARSLRESFKKVRAHAKLRWVGFHDFRHMFASAAVMAGVDFMTVASWLGHRDGGILVGKVYGHLADAHKREAAAKLRF